MAGWYELKKSSNDKYYFVLKAGNAEVILTSEMYEARPSAENGIRSVRTTACWKSAMSAKKPRTANFISI